MGWDAPLDEDYHRELTKVVVTLERKIHAAGKLLMMPFSLGVRKAVVDGLEAINVDLAYMAESNCYAYGLREAKQSIDELRNRKR
jgi:hypothetical protein